MNNQLLKQLRSEIDQIDYDILKLIKKRQQTAEMIGMVKYENNMKIYHPEREDIILDNFEIYLNIQILILILLSILLKGIVSISKEYKKYLDIN